MGVNNNTPIINGCGQDVFHNKFNSKSKDGPKERIQILCESKLSFDLLALHWFLYG